MPYPAPSWASLSHSERLADAPVVRRVGRWWLVSPSGTMLASDLTGELDRFAADIAAANRAVADLHSARDASNGPVREVRR
ncbi:hypothetical protein [Streptomyces nigrescens]|uniref:Uncharacterized protein n=1 Tax=Streptomyces nigrescens TaxID=1920 RepID=A0A640TR29_STRNI|nr:hypothetical protein [Streptomyces libani]WAU00081.1 hypothetical protein STRLI_006297 [Streptomyces libani subsp. libani]GFE25704.1 hypothetical protein Sliba_61570 [Streptomyces libani subsp. libani]GGV98800.1 hypothetical protein GCM10010500_48320 [Streptomyces libani subsp. libani]